MPTKAMQQHDHANLCILPVLGGLCMAAYFQFVPYVVPMSLMLAYIAMDFVWIALVPSCVPKSTLILVHHVFTAVLIVVALTYIDRFGVYGALDGMVELNTFFLIARRTFPLPSLQPLFNVCYWATYPLLRLFMYPYVLYLLLDELAGEVVLALLIYPCQIFLVGFNCLLLYLTWPRATAHPAKRRAFHADGRVRMGMAPRVHR